MEAQDGKKFAEEELMKHGMSPATLSPKKGKKKKKSKAPADRTSRYDGQCIV